MPQEHRDIVISKYDLRKEMPTMFFDIAVANWGCLTVEVYCYKGRREPTGKLMAHTPSKKYLRTLRKMTRPCDRIAHFSRTVADLSTSYRLVYEHLNHSNNKGKDTLLGCQGALISHYADAGEDEITPINNKLWKKAVCGNGNASKKEVHKYLTKHYGSLIKRVEGEVTEDILDCLCLLITKVKMNRGIL